MLSQTFVFPNITAGMYINPLVPAGSLGKVFPGGQCHKLLLEIALHELNHGDNDKRRSIKIYCMLFITFPQVA